MVGSGVALDPRVVEGFLAMTQTAMEDAIKNLDRRMGAVEQILPTLATKEDLLAAKADLQAEIVATRRHLTGSIEEVTRQSDARFEGRSVTPTCAH